ncbi:DUF2161 domain-containing phosphodiesterase [uncultured Brevibacillus sp.]|uniref:DUF2161 domain-containing phosphodiesterase n=1 Tax=uncultured Brevibacillus sp. TaxID=169970 RepID=UPI00259412D5|nr:DUF2161 family putative PD-(D/E)XK-type phosphodiesterase [uncultured Brevibacillus sp.]
MKTKTEKRYEVDLYKPIRNYFVKQGYEVFGEVKHCDVAAIKEEELVIVECKLNLSVELLIQATKRQRLTDQVYVAIPKPKYSLFSKKWQDITHMIRRLELGLILVSFSKNGATMEVKIPPGPFDRQKSMRQNQRIRSRVIAEIKGRYGDYNVGGSHQTKIMTAYKQSCIQIASLLQQHGPQSPKSLRQMGTGDKTLSILAKNYYGWFEKVKRGVYAVTDAGKNEINAYPELVAHYVQSKQKGEFTREQP